MSKEKIPTRRGRASEVLGRLHREDPSIREEIDKEKEKSKAASLIYDARSAARMSQETLAKLVNTSQSQIARLEDGDYDGHTIRTMERIASVLGMRYVQAFEPIKK